MHSRALLAQGLVADVLEGGGMTLLALILGLLLFACLLSVLSHINGGDE